MWPYVDCSFLRLLLIGFCFLLVFINSFSVLTAIFQVTWVSQSLLKQRMMEVVVTTGALSRAKLQSNHHTNKPNIPFFLQARCPSCRPTNSVKALKGKISHCMDLLTQAHLGVFQLCLCPLITPSYLGEGCHASHQPSDASTPTGVY